MKVPKYRKHSSRDYAIVEFGGRRHSLPGPYNSAESRAAYNRFLADHVYTSQPPQELTVYRPPAGRKLFINGLVLAFLDHVKAQYPDADNPRCNYQNVRRVATAFSDEYGAELAEDFGPLRLKEYLAKLAKDGAARSYCNKQLGLIKQMFKWGVSEELILPSVHQALATVEGLRRGRTTAPDYEPRHPVGWPDVHLTLAYCPGVIQTMVLVQWHTGCRSGSLCLATPSQFTKDGTDTLWMPRHKSEYLGKDMAIPIGPQCLELLKPLLERPADAYIFSPRDGRNASNRRYRERYDPGSYRQAVSRAQDAAIASGLKLTKWVPHQLRHAKATLVRQRYGIEAARVALGHASADVTAIYAERDLELAKRIARETG